MLLGRGGLDCPSGWTEVPTDTLALVARRLEGADAAAATTACKAWCQAFTVGDDCAARLQPVPASRAASLVDAVSCASVSSCQAHVHRVQPKRLPAPHRLAARFPSLRALDLGAYRRVTDADLAGLTLLTSLRALSLAGCGNVTDDGVASLRRLLRLQDLSLSNCCKVLPWLRGAVRCNRFAASPRPRPLPIMSDSCEACSHCAGCAKLKRSQ
jgi:hypothetical protein